MKYKIIIIFAVIVVIVLGIFYFMGDDEPLTKEDLRDYFKEEILKDWKKGFIFFFRFRPIHGIDEPILRNIYSGLINKDFEEVETVGSLRGTDDLITSGDAQITDNGMLTLLDNLSDRLGIPLKNRRSVDRILKLISEKSEVAYSECKERCDFVFNNEENLMNEDDLERCYSECDYSFKP